MKDTFNYHDTFWDIAPYSLVKVEQRFIDAYLLHDAVVQTICTDNSVFILTGALYLTQLFSDMGI
jgi:hypothetical protein